MAGGSSRQISARREQESPAEREARTRNTLATMHGAKIEALRKPKPRTTCSTISRRWKYQGPVGRSAERSGRWLHSSRGATGQEDESRGCRTEEEALGPGRKKYWEEARGIIA